MSAVQGFAEIVGIFTCWCAMGLIGTWMDHRSSDPASRTKKEAYAGALLGPLLPLMCIFYNPLDLLLWPKDRRNPFADELREVIRLRRSLQFLPGEDAGRERERLEDVIDELRAWPGKLRDQDGDRLVAAMRSEYETAVALSRSRLEAYERIEQEITDEARAELS